VAGVLPQGNWNQAYGNSGAVSALVDNAGTATNASVEWSSPNMYYTPIADVPGNNRLMKGYQDTSNTIPTTVEVKSIPASFEHYDIYVYFDGGNGPVARTANFRILTESNDEPNPSADATRSSKEFSGCPYGVMKQGTIITGLDAANTDFSGTFTLASGGAPGNYVLFPDCHGHSFRLLAVHGASTDSQYRAPVNAIQIVSITQDRKKEEH
jgi:hypothetical protein